MKHNAAQEEAIRHIDGPCMVLAGPGSGKTRVITYRTEHLIREAGVDPKSILVITFTKAAALEMQQRFLSLSGDKGKACTFGTFHSVFFMILRAAYGYHAHQVLSEEQKWEILKHLVKPMKLAFQDEEELIRNLIAEITMVKSEYIRIEHYYSTSCGEDVFREIYRAYNEELYRREKLDFDDMLVYTYELLREREDILAMWQRRFPYILIDEFQDINRIQYEIVKLLAGDKKNLFMVGDDDQSIYRFRGARPELMLSVMKDYPDIRMIRLQVNYRSGSEIVEASERLIRHNTKRYEKHMESFVGKKAPITYHKVKNEEQEVRDILARIQAYREAGIGYSNQAILYRTNLEPRKLVRMLTDEKIPFLLKDRIPNCYNHWIGRNIAAYLSIAAGSEKRSDYMQIINRPVRYLKADYFVGDTIDPERVLERCREKPYAVDAFTQMLEDISYMTTMTPYAAIVFVRKRMGYDAYIRQYATQQNLFAGDLLAILDEIEELAKPYRTFEDWFVHVKNYEQELLALQERERRDKDADAITLSTMHSSKGLEYQVVYVINVNDGITPYKKASKPEEIEEERRMFYVACTRAKEFLHLYSLEERFGKKIAPSGFLVEMGITLHK